MNVFHYTDKGGWNAIRALSPWRFKIHQPKDPGRPEGAYFTTIEPNESNLRTLHKRIRIPVLKQQYVFWFLGSEGLSNLNRGRGRDKYILHSPVDYLVEKTRQKYEGETEGVLGQFR